ncbi:MAG: 2-C-methyl-D-erythritol 4-phosphate cytidylyltransferase [Deltaproteobacteria bacterium]|nr:2-C-methyl-D-erythritol 4-phosphate cytidylyltransferase [Deltaproteobacteria bacterium]
MVVSAIIVAAGKGIRMGDDDVRKQYLLLDDRPLISHTIEVFDECSIIDEIFLVVPEEDFVFCNENILNQQNFQKKVSLVPGGARRQDSVYNGLLAIDNIIDDSIAVIHDGVRPFIRSEQLTECITCATDYDACIFGIPAYDTLKRVNSSGFIENTIERNTIWLAQTPQAFKYNLIRRAHENAIHTGINGTDDAMLVEQLGIKVRVVTGSRCNIKITTKEDLLLARAMIRAEAADS